MIPIFPIPPFDGGKMKKFPSLVFPKFAKIFPPPACFPNPPVPQKHTRGRTERGKTFFFPQRRRRQFIGKVFFSSPVFFFLPLCRRKTSLFSPSSTFLPAHQISLRGGKILSSLFYSTHFFFEGQTFSYPWCEKKAPPRKIRQKRSEKMDRWRINRPTTFQAINLSNCQTYSKTNSRGG